MSAIYEQGAGLKHLPERPRRTGRRRRKEGKVRRRRLWGEKQGRGDGLKDLARIHHRKGILTLQTCRPGPCKFPSPLASWKMAGVRGCRVDSGCDVLSPQTLFFWEAIHGLRTQKVAVIVPGAVEGDCSHSLRVLLDLPPGWQRTHRAGPGVGVRADDLAATSHRRQQDDRIEIDAPELATRQAGSAAESQHWTQHCSHSKVLPGDRKDFLNPPGAAGACER